jgi:hypothetical protein
MCVALLALALGPLAAQAQIVVSDPVVLTPAPVVTTYYTPAVVTSYYPTVPVVRAYYTAPVVTTYYAAPVYVAPTVTTYRYGLFGHRRVDVVNYGAPAYVVPRRSYYYSPAVVVYP